ncbi:MAG: RsmB/NOP family class I SAM-dependent RNA methyltransferase [Candidatus Puniceispirillaceae bacterium]
MADSSDRGDNVTKLDKPVLSLKKPSAKAVTGRSKPAPSKTRTAQNKSRAGGAKPTGKPTGKSTGKPTGKPTGAPALQSRQIVFDILTAVEEGSQLDKALAAHADLPKLDGRDRRFVQLLATTYLRRRGQLEKILAPLMTRRPFGAQADANIILAMGAAQLLFLKTGAHAAVDSTVELMRQAGFERLCGLANAVMRRLTRDGDTLLATTHDAENLPEWLRLSWQHYWGDEATDMIAGLAMLPPSLDISVAADAAHWAEKLDGKLLHGNTIRREFDGDPAQLDGFADGAWWVQDAAAAMPARLLDQLAGKQVIDLCAAPGGKTAQLIAAGADVTAIDSNRKRLDRLRRNLKRLNMPSKLVLSDGRSFVPETPVDAVLLDAPCSATGTIRRRPDILGRRSSADISSLQTIQWELATTALGWLKPGGQMIYATCSLQPEEGEDIIAAILEAADGRYQLAPITSAEAGLFGRSITENGCLRILPSSYADIGGVDGFFIARLMSKA